MYQITCPSCFKTIPASQSYEGTYVCECGVKVRTGDNTKRATASARSGLIVLGLLVIVSFIHATNWDNYSIEILPLKTKQLLGMASYEDLRRVAVICQDRKKAFCQEAALIEASNLDSKDKDILLEIADLQVSRSAFELSHATLSKYFKLGGNSRVARYQLGLSLWKIGKIKDAKKHLHYLVFSDKNHLEIQAARSYVALLMEQKDFTAARKVISHCRTIGNNTAMFLEKEMKEIQQRMPATI